MVQETRYYRTVTEALKIRFMPCKWLALQSPWGLLQTMSTYLYCNPIQGQYRARTGPNREKPVFITGIPANGNRFFPVGKNLQGKPCFHYVGRFAVQILKDSVGSAFKQCTQCLFMSKKRPPIWLLQSLNELKLNAQYPTQACSAHRCVSLKIFWCKRIVYKMGYLYLEFRP